MSTDETSLFKRLLSVGLSRGYANDLANGKRLPSLKMAVFLEQQLNIPPSDWVQVTERPTNKRAAEAA